MSVLYPSTELSKACTFAFNDYMQGNLTGEQFARKWARNNCPGPPPVDGQLSGLTPWQPAGGVVAPNRQVQSRTTVLGLPGETGNAQAVDDSGGVEGFQIGEGPSGGGTTGAGGAGTAISSQYFYTFTSSNGLTFSVLRDETPPKITDGRGGWQVVDRRRRKGLTVWVGRNPLKMDVPILFDGWFDSPVSVDPDVAILQQMALGDDFIVPPTLTVDGLLPALGVNWVIEDLTWGEKAVWISGPAGDNIRVRQDCVVHLLQFVDADVVKTSTKPGTAGGIVGSFPTHPFVVTDQLNTPKKIGLYFFHRGEGWKYLAIANPGIVRGPYQVLPTGLTIQIPPDLRSLGLGGTEIHALLPHTDQTKTP